MQFIFYLSIITDVAEAVFKWESATLELGQYQSLFMTQIQVNIACCEIVLLELNIRP